MTGSRVKKVKDHILLTSSRLTLREFTLNDYEDVYSYASDPEVVKYIPWNIYTLDDARKSINRKIAGQRKKPRDTYELAALLKEDEKLIGECYLSLTDLMEADLGFCIHRDYWGRGIATEITGILLKFGFRELNLHRIIATCDPRNQASINILEKNGFRREGYFKEHKLMRGNWRDSLFYAILDKEWKNCIRE